jgi:hypothetical protein
VRPSTPLAAAPLPEAPEAGKTVDEWFGGRLSELGGGVAGDGVQCRRFGQVRRLHLRVEQDARGWIRGDRDGESFPRVCWVAVPKTLRARRLNNGAMLVQVNVGNL